MLTRGLYEYVCSGWHSRALLREQFEHADHRLVLLKNVQDGCHAGELAGARKVLGNEMVRMVSAGDQLDTDWSLLR